MPNGSRTFYLNRSQPPFFSQAVRDIFEVTGDIEWLARAEKRKLLMNRLMWSTEKEAFYDYDFKKQKVSDFFSAASFYPLAFGLATNEQAEKTVAHLPKIEMQYGIAGCEERGDNRHLQWDYPNGWGCLQYIVIKGLLNYGYRGGEEKNGVILVDVCGKGGVYHNDKTLCDILTGKKYNSDITVEPYQVLVLEE